MMILPLKRFPSAIWLQEENRSFLFSSRPRHGINILAGRLSTGQNREHGTLRMVTAFKAQLQATVRE
jgi:hypothetical protein